MLKKIVFAIVLFTVSSQLSGQINVDYQTPKEYEIGGITVSGIRYLDHDVLINLSGLKVGTTIEVPGTAITDAIDKLWKQGLFSDVKISATKVEGSKIFLDIYLQERPRLAQVTITGLKRGETETVEELIELTRGMQVTDNIINQTKYKIKTHFAEKGFYNTEINIVQKDDTTLQNAANLYIHIDKNDKVKVDEIVIRGNSILSETKIMRAMKKTNEKSLRNFFRPKKYIEDEYENDKAAVLQKYRALGYRDVQIAWDTVYMNSEKTVKIEMEIKEGPQYFFGEITWVGNTKYSSEQLSKALGITKGDVFNQELLDNRLVYDMDAVGNLYLDDGYLFYTCTAIETNVENDTIDIEMQIHEGKQAVIKKVIISGNTRTNEHVVRRELYSRPGDLFSKTNIQRSIRELAQLGHFDPEQLDVMPYPNPQDGTVDLEYTLTERANDQIEVSGGWGAGMVVGTVGLRFNNFAASRLFEKGAWTPIPMGDGQSLSLRVQSNGRRYQSYNFSFVEPWLGGKKPNSFTSSLYHTKLTNNLPADHDEYAFMKINGVAFGLGRRLKWPDDYFTLYHELSFQNYQLEQWSGFLFSTGTSNNFSFKTVFARNSIDNPLYARSGSEFSLGLQITPPFSLINGRNYSGMSDDEKYKWIEYHKWSFKAGWYTRLVDDLVLYSKFQFGYLGYFNSDIGPSPFEGYNVGGDGLSYSMYGVETIPLRGYKNGTLTPDNGANVYNKFTMELRYPVALKASTTIYALLFAESGNAWNSIDDFNPFSMHRSAGVGVRIFLPMIGLMGIDWGYGFDEIPGQSDAHKGQFHIVLGQQL